jgi:hypothetical protein
VLHDDGLSSHSLEEIEEHFMHLFKFHALQRADDPDWQFRSAATSDDEFEHLKSYVKKLIDTKFRQPLVSAGKEFYSQIREPFMRVMGGATIWKALQ